MRIACPSCAAQYEVPTSRLTSRKMVRCVRCGGEWAAVEKAGQPDPAHAVEETPEVPQRQPAASSAPVTAMDHLAATAALPPRRSGGLIAAWILTLAVLIVAVAATIAWRDTVTRIWPASSRILGTADTPTPAPARSLGKLPD